MTAHLIIYGHGAGDPGAVGNGTNERDFNRKTLHPYIKKWADDSKDTFVFFDTTGNKDMFQETSKGWGMYSISPKTYASVTEIHEDAASSTATGGHTIVSSSLTADSKDLKLSLVIKNIVEWWGSVKNTKGISYRNNLLNLNVAAQRGINYRLMELGFITNKNDMDKIKANLDQYAKGIVEGITGEKLGGTTVAKAKVLDAKKFPAMVKMVRGNKVYNGPNFGPKSLSRAFFPKDTVIYASGIVYSDSGKPRIKTNSGHILATDNYVKFL